MQQECKTQYFGAVQAGCIQTNHLRVCQSLTDCEGNTYGCVNVETATSPDGAPNSGPLQLCPNETLRLWSNSINLSATAGSVNVQLETKFRGGLTDPEPSLECEPGDLYVNLNTGDVYVCQNGTWVFVTTIGGGGACRNPMNLCVDKARTYTSDQLFVPFTWDILNAFPLPSQATYDQKNATVKIFESGQYKVTLNLVCLIEGTNTAFTLYCINGLPPPGAGNVVCLVTADRVFRDTSSTHSQQQIINVTADALNPYELRFFILAEVGTGERIDLLGKDLAVSPPRLASTSFTLEYICQRQNPIVFTNN